MTYMEKNTWNMSTVKKYTDSILNTNNFLHSLIQFRFKFDNIFTYYEEP